MDRVPALAAMAVGLLLVANPLYLDVASAATAFPAVLLVAQGSLALYGVLLAVAGWFGRSAASHDWLLWTLAVGGVGLAAVPLAGVEVGVLTLALVAGLAAVVGGLPGTVVLFRAAHPGPS